MNDCSYKDKLSIHFTTLLKLHKDKLSIYALVIENLVCFPEESRWTFPLTTFNPRFLRALICYYIHFSIIINLIKHVNLSFLSQKMDARILNDSYSVKKSTKAIPECNFYHSCINIWVLVYDHFWYRNFIGFLINYILLNTQMKITMKLENFKKK